MSWKWVVGINLTVALIAATLGYPWVSAWTTFALSLQVADDNTVWEW